MKRQNSPFDNIATIAHPVLIGQPLLSSGVNYMEEIWKDIEGYEGLYKVSNLGNIVNVNYYNRGYERPLKQRLNRTGYWTVGLSKHNIATQYTIHRLVALHFIPKVEGKNCINHINGIRTDNSLSNLEWCTQKENMVHSFKFNGRRSTWLGRFGGIHPTSKKVMQFDVHGKLLKIWDAATEAGRDLKINIPHISSCCNGKRNTCGGYVWRHYIPEEI